MEEKLLSSLDPARFMNTSGWNFKKSWSGKIDVSVWLRAHFLRGGRMYLLLEYRDQERRYSIPVDRCMTQSSDSILLTGRVNLSGRGDLQRLQVKLKFDKCDASSIILEELSVKTRGVSVPSRMSEAV